MPADSATYNDKESILSQSKFLPTRMSPLVAVVWKTVQDNDSIEYIQKNSIVRKTYNRFIMFDPFFYV